MGYSMTRAIPMGIIGFVLGAALVVLLRGLQQMDEVWSTQLGLTIGGLFAAIFFLWGIGALSGKMAEHVIHEPEEDEFGNELPVEEHHHDDPTPVGILQEQMWSITFWVCVVTIGAFAFAALPGGLGYTVSIDAAANPNANGYFTMEIPGGQVVVVSKVVAFVFFVVFTMISLFGMSWLVAKALIGLNTGIKTVKVEGNQPLNVLPVASNAGLLTAGEQGETVVTPAVPSFNRRKLAMAVITGLVLLWLFYEALIGWIFKVSPTREILSVTNAILLPILIFYTKQVLWTIGRVARGTAHVLRGLPAFLGQK